MAVVNAVPRDKVAEDVGPMYDDLAKRFGRVPNIFGVMAHRPEVILYADRLTRSAAAVRDGTLQDLGRHFSEDQIVELTLVICVANFTNRFNDGLRLEPDLG